MCWTSTRCPRPSVYSCDAQSWTSGHTGVNRRAWTAALSIYLCFYIYVYKYIYMYIYIYTRIQHLVCYRIHFRLDHLIYIYILISLSLALSLSLSLSIYIYILSWEPRCPRPSVYSCNAQWWTQGPTGKSYNTCST